MPFVAIIGAGPLGGALAHTLAARDRVREVRLIDDDERIAAGKAIDIRQASPVVAVAVPPGEGGGVVFAEERFLGFWTPGREPVVVNTTLPLLMYVHTSS